MSTGTAVEYEVPNAPSGWRSSIREVSDPDRLRSHPVEVSEEERSRQEEIGLVRRIQAGDAEAFARLYEIHRAPVERFIRRQMGALDEVEDLTQDTFVEAFRSIGRFEGRSRVRTWLFGIARYMCARYFRSSSRWVTGLRAGELPPDLSSDESVERRVEAARCLRKAVAIGVDGGRPASARVFAARFGKGLTAQQIASEVGLSKDAVKASLTRSRRRIKRRLPHYREVLADASPDEAGAPRRSVLV